MSVRLVYDLATPTRERRPTTREDVYADVCVETLMDEQELYERLLELADMDADEFETDYDGELTTDSPLEEKIEHLLTYLEDPGDGSPNIMYVAVDGKPKYEKYWVTYFDPKEAGIHMGTASETKIADAIIELGGGIEDEGDDDIPDIETKTIYVVRSDTDDNNVHMEFDDEDEAMEYAKNSDDAIVYRCEVEVDEDGDIIDEISDEIIWSYADDVD